MVFLALVFLLDGGKDLRVDLVDRETAAFEHGETRLKKGNPIQASGASVRARGEG
ncbi:hypothetical protein D3C87_2181930 [compost metagenome]